MVSLQPNKKQHIIPNQKTEILYLRMAINFLF